MIWSRETPERHGSTFSHLAEGGRCRAQPHRRRHRHPLRSVVEPGCGRPGDRPHSPHWAGQAGDRGAPRRAGDHRRENPLAQGQEARTDARRPRTSETSARAPRRG